MKAIVLRQFGDPSVLKLEDYPDPAPGPGQILVKVHAIGVNPVETYIRAGRYGPRPFPLILGNDAAGIVAAVGPGVTRVKTGDRVYTAGTITGAYAELTLCEQSKVHPLPNAVSFAQGAAIGTPYGTAYRALFHRDGAQSGETVLIHGATGGVGLAALQLARAAGLTIFATGGTPRGLELLNSQGAHHVFDHTNPGYLQQITADTNGLGVNLILEMLANVNLANDLTLLAKNGRVMVIGSRGRIEIDPRDTMGREADIRGVFLGNTSDSQYAAMHKAIVAGLQHGTLTPLVDRDFPLFDAAKAHEAVMSPGHHGKIILVA